MDSSFAPECPRGPLQGILDQFAERPTAFHEGRETLQVCFGEEPATMVVMRSVADALPGNAAPGGLADVSLPTDCEGVAALFGRLPTHINAARRSRQPDQEPDCYGAYYGEGDGSALVAAFVATADRR